MQKGYAMKYFIASCMLILSLLATCATYAEVIDTPHYDVVAEYIRSLSAIHRIQKTADIEFQEANQSDNPGIAMLMSGIRSSTRIKLELNTSIAALKGMKLKKPFETLLPMTIGSYQHKIDLHNEIIKISKSFIAGPKPGVDYSKMTARMPEITVSVEYIDETIFQMMPLVFALLIDEKPDSEGHMSHLNITKEKRQKLIDNINGCFGESLDKDKKNWTVSSAALLKAYLLKDYKCTDEWQK